MSSVESSVVAAVVSAGAWRRAGLLVAAAALAACGGHKTGGSTIPDAPDPIGDGTTGAVGDGGDGARAEVTPAALCDRIFELQAARCSLVDGYDLDRAGCIADYTRSLEDRGPDARAATEIAGRCLLDNDGCGAVTACFEKLADDANNGAPEQYRSCGQTDVYAPVGLSRADWDKRKGASVRRFSQARSTKDDPVAVCGIPAEMTWLMAATCDDGNNPFASRDHAHAARVGNVGPGGACGSIIDLYEVPCPEGTYGIYMDAYVCPVPDGVAVPHD